MVSKIASDHEHPTEIIISSLREQQVNCCQLHCLEQLLNDNKDALALFLEEWLQLDKKQKELVVRFTIRLCSHWSPRTVRYVDRQRNRFAFEDPLLGRLCRRSYALIIGVGEATLARYANSVYTSGGRFIPPPHKSEGKEGNRQLNPDVRQEAIRFLVEMAMAVGEESPGRHSQRSEEKNHSPQGRHHTAERAIVFFPAMYSLRLLHHLYLEKSGHPVSWKTFSTIFQSEELSWLRIRSPRDDVCDVCLLYRRKMAELLRKEGTKITLDQLGGISSEFVKHRNLSIATRNVYRAECKTAQQGALKIQELLENNAQQGELTKLLKKYDAHYSFDFCQSLWLPQMSDTPGQFYFLSLRSINLFGIVDDGGIGTPIQTNLLYDQTTASKGSSEVVSMLYYFLIHCRQSSVASRRIFFHADNCVGQNKNNIVLQFFLWCIAIGICDHIELKFLLKGHTKFSPDGGFGMIKKHYRRTNAYAIEQVAEAIKKSTHETERNQAIILEKKNFGHWKSGLQKFFIHLKGISDFSVFVFDKTYSLGEVHVRKHEEDKFKKYKLLKPGLDPKQLLYDKNFLNLQKQLLPLNSPEMQAKKQWDLYEKVRPHVPIEYQDIICPQPSVDKKKQC